MFCRTQIKNWVLNNLELRRFLCVGLSLTFSFHSVQKLHPVCWRTFGFVCPTVVTRKLVEGNSIILEQTLQIFASSHKCIVYILALMLDLINFPTFLTMLWIQTRIRVDFGRLDRIQVGKITHKEKWRKCICFEELNILFCEGWRLLL